MRLAGWIKMLAVTTIALLSAGPLTGQAPYPVVPQVLPAVVVVEVSGVDRGGTARTVEGTGFFIDAAGYLVTAAHVFRSEDGWRDRTDGTGPDFRITVRTQSGTLTRANVIYLDEQADLALVRVGLQPAQTVQVLVLGDSRVVDPGFGVAAFGSDNGAGVFRGRGNVSVAFDSTYFGVFKINVTTERGDSGAPVVDDASGAVLGVVRAGIAGQPKTYVTPINLASNLVRIIESADAELDFARRAGVPPGAVLAFYLTENELARLAPDWLPARGQVLADPQSPFHGAALPDLQERFVLGASAGANVRDNGATTVGGSSSWSGETTPVETGARLVGFESYYRDEGLPPKFVIDTEVKEGKVSDHKHAFEVRDVWPPFRRLVYMIRVR